MRGAIQLRMIGWQLTQNNNIICIFSKKLNYFCSTSMTNNFKFIYIRVNEKNRVCDVNASCLSGLGFVLKRALKLLAITFLAGNYDISHGDHG